MKDATAPGASGLYADDARGAVCFAIGYLQAGGDDALLRDVIAGLERAKEALP